MTDIQIIKTTLVEDHKLVLIRLKNLSGFYVDITNHGASIVSIVVPNSEGDLKNVVLAYNQLGDYQSDTYYIGTTVGRYANRISEARFELDGNIYNLDKNDGENSNHGGFNGFGKKLFDYEILSDGVKFTANSIDGEGGFPGNLRLEVIYRFSNENRLSITYKSVSDRATPVNFTNHTYFNLSDTGNTIWNHELQISSPIYLEMGNDFLPTGKILEVNNTAFDFQTSARIYKNALLKQDNLQGYNSFFIQNNISPKTAIASLYEPISGRIVDVYTSMSGVQIYTGDFLSEPFVPFAGICMEAQYHPNGINNPRFATCILSPNREVTDIIEYQFRTI